MPKKLKTGRKRWLGLVRIPGTNKRTSQACETRKEAVAWEEMTKQRLSELRNPETATVSLGSVVEMYLDAVKARQARASYEDKRVAFRILFQTVPPSTPAIRVSYGQIERVLSDVAQEVSGHRANRLRTHFVSCWNWGVRALGLPSDCPWKVDRFKHEAKARIVPTETAFWRVVETAEGQDRAMLLFALYTACRRGELLSCKWEDIDLDKRTVRLWTAKRRGGRQADIIPMVEPLRRVLLEQRPRTGLMPYVFVRPRTREPFKERREILPNLCKRAGVKPFNWHGIRHLSASILAGAGVPIPAIQAILRHRNATTTDLYLHSLGAVRNEIEAAFRGNNGVMTTPIAKGVTEK